jgi:hypothetical protein
MSLESALARLRSCCRDLSLAVSELVTIVHEDRPPDSDVAVIDALTETVSELQSSAVAAAELVDHVAEPRALPARLGAIDAAVADCATTYWRDLRAFRPISQLRVAARRGDLEWRTWQKSVEASQQRCELPLFETHAAVRTAWTEAAEILGLYLPSPQTSPDPDAVTTAVAGPTTRRPQ